LTKAADLPVLEFLINLKRKALGLADERSSQIGIRGIIWHVRANISEWAVRLVDAAEVRRVLTFPILIVALEAAHGRTKMRFKTGFLAARANSTSSAMPLTAAAGSGHHMTGAIRAIRIARGAIDDGVA
jgi:hypothetical protein